MNVLDFLPAGAMKYVASTNCGEWAGPCPSCGGDDRFRVWPEHPSGAKGGRYLCRGGDCILGNGDGIDFLRRHRGVNFIDACKALGVNMDTKGRRLISAYTPSKAHQTKPPTTLPPAWQERAARFVADCAKRMVPESRGLAYALSRHLTPETIAELDFGWNPSGRYEKRSEWGLVADENGQGKPKTVWLPGGLVIPSQSAEGVTGVKIRRRKWHQGDGKPKYIVVPGTRPGLSLRNGSARPVVVVESEIDAALIWQEAGDLVDALALGTASRIPDTETMAYLNASSLVMVSLDYDEAGIKATKNWQQFRNAKLWPVAMGKDVGDMAGTAGLVREWVTFGLQSLLTQNA